MDTNRSVPNQGVAGHLKHRMRAVAVVVGLLYAYTLVHEGGHALVVLLCGGRITHMALGLGARVQFVGADFSRTTASLFDVAGVLLPLLVMAVAVSFYRRTVRQPLYHLVWFLASVGILGSLAAWVIIPVLSLVATPPAGDDVTKFLQSSQLNPVVVLAGALVLGGLLATEIARKGVFRERRERRRAEEV